MMSASRFLGSGLRCALVVTGLGLAALGGAAARAGDAAPRAMSINLCADQLLLALLPPERITSVSWLARNVSQSYLAASAARVPVNFGTAEEVARQHPDVLVAGTFTTPATRALLHRVGLRMVELPPLNSFDEIRAGTRLVADAVGARARGEELLAHMDERLGWLSLHPLTQRWHVVLWDGSGAVPGRGTLYDAVLTSAGASDATAAGQGSMYAQYDLETLLRHSPDVIVQSDPAFAHAGLRNDLAQHAVIDRRWANRRVYLAHAALECGSPFTADVAVQAHDALAALGETRR